MSGAIYCDPHGERACALCWVDEKREAEVTALKARVAELETRLSIALANYEETRRAAFEEAAKKVEEMVSNSHVSERVAAAIRSLAKDGAR